MFVDQHTLSLIIRYVHVAAMAILVGGAVLVWSSLTAASKLSSGANERQALDVAVRYEWLFWIAIGLLIMTGVGNLGAFGTGLPRPQTSWGERLTLKLTLVALLTLGSVLRTLLVAVPRAEGGPTLSARGWTMLQASYGVTALLAALIVLLAMALAHG